MASRRARFFGVRRSPGLGITGTGPDQPSSAFRRSRRAACSSRVIARNAADLVLQPGEAVIAGRLVADAPVKLGLVDVVRKLVELDGMIELGGSIAAAVSKFRK